MSDYERRSVHDWAGAKWQVIFTVTRDGRTCDYCRETRDGGMADESKVVEWARQQLPMLARRHPGAVFAFKLERW